MKTREAEMETALRAIVNIVDGAQKRSEDQWASTEQQVVMDAILYLALHPFRKKEGSRCGTCGSTADQELRIRLQGEGLICGPCLDRLRGTTTGPPSLVP